MKMVKLFLSDGTFVLENYEKFRLMPLSEISKRYDRRLIMKVEFFDDEKPE